MRARSVRNRCDTIFPMRRVARFLIVLLLLAGLPLRGYAAVAAALCEAHHGGAPVAHAAEHDHGSAHEHETNDGDRHPIASVCSICASCSVGATLAPDSVRPVATSAAGADRIPFFSKQASGHVPRGLDRPPLVL